MDNYRTMLDNFQKSIVHYISGAEKPPSFKPDSYPHFLEIACGADQYCWGCETVSNDNPLFGPFHKIHL